uniref:Uncharacterized protein n=1 Tax=Panagrolaimus sp. JU765 TaxID=591449 RepID=A0AC34R989_9BILA
MLLLSLFIFCLIGKSFQDFPFLKSYLDEQTRITADNDVFFDQTKNQYENPPDMPDGDYVDYLPIHPITRIDFGIFKNRLPSDWTFKYLKVFEKTKVRIICSQIHYTQWNVFRTLLVLVTEFRDGTDLLANAADLHDTNFPCNDADEKTVKSWAHNGRQVMYSVYFDEMVDDK